MKPKRLAISSLPLPFPSFPSICAAQWGCFWQEESWQNPLTVIADAPPIGGKLGAPQRWGKKFHGLVENFVGGLGNEEGPCFRRTTDIIVAKSQWYTIRICNPSGRGIFFGVSEFPWFFGSEKNSPCLTSRGLCLESFWLCRFGDIYQDVSPGPHWPGVSWMP